MASGVVNNLLSNGFGNRAFNWVSWNGGNATNGRLDSLPTYGEEWIACAYSPDWANEPQYGWGIIFKICVPDALWGWEIALTTDATPALFIRNSINGNPWSAWTRIQ